MSSTAMVTLDGNEAAAYIAHLTNEIIAIYPITPSSPMGEHADNWSAHGIENLWGSVPRVIEMQSEAGAAGTVHGALQSGALATTFTSSQGLLLMIPNMYKIAGELTPVVFHVAARTLATHALSIFGDHSDVMAARSTGFAMLCSNSVQEAMDMALIAQAATLESRLPIMHFFDGFRTSHEVAKVEQVGRESARSMISDQAVQAHRARALRPDAPVLRGSSQNPDVYFQAREAVNPYYRRMPGIVQAVMDRFAGLTGRQYRLADYAGAPDAEGVIVLMGSGAETVQETVAHLNAHGENVGVVKLRLFRPFPAAELIGALPATVRRIAVLDRTKEPGAAGEPLYQDVVTAITEHFVSGGGRFPLLPRVIGGRYGLSSKEFTPAMAKSVFDELTRDNPRNHFTVGIVDDVSHTSLAWDPAFRTDAGREVMRAVFYGLGSDGTVSANKNTIKIIGEQTDRYAQGYFVYDSKKAGAATISHLRFGPQPIRSAYLIGADEAHFVGCHQPVFLERYDVLETAADGAVFLLNSPLPPERVWDTLPRPMQRQIIDKGLECYVIDAYGVAKESGMGNRINTIMQTCFFAISGILPPEAAIQSIKAAVAKSYGKRGKDIVERNYRAIDRTLANLRRLAVPALATATAEPPQAVPPSAPDFVRRVTAEIMAGRGDLLPVSAFPPDGTWPTGTSVWDKRNLARDIPIWDEALCIYCGKCPFVCPHSAIRSKVFATDLLRDAPPAFKHTEVKGKEFEPGLHISYQVAPEDCTGCGLCVDACPAASKTDPSRKALEMRPQAPLRAQEKENWEFFLQLPEFDRSKLRAATIKGAMVFQPLFEFPTACSGCGETPYIRLATQLFGDRMVIANATGCSSIYGGNLPTTPYCRNGEGQGPAWANSLFEDNAEFGLGFRLAIDQQASHARRLLRQMQAEIGPGLAQALLEADQSSEQGILEQRKRVEALRGVLAGIGSAAARSLESVARALVRHSVWIIGGDGWAYDIGFGGLDHVLASGQDVNLLVLDTEVYSNTGGQASKATPRGAMAKFASNGKASGKKDLAQIAMSYGNVYVAQVAYGAKDLHTLKSFLEAESYEGPSLIIAYSPCIEHGFDLGLQHRQQELAVSSGHWPLFRHDPRRLVEGKNPLMLDSKEPSTPYREFIRNEARFRGLLKAIEEGGEEVLAPYQEEIRRRFRLYQYLAQNGIDATPV